MIVWKQSGKRRFSLYNDKESNCFKALLGFVEMEKYTCRWGGSIIEDGWPSEPKYFNTKREAMGYVERNVN